MINNIPNTRFSSFGCLGTLLGAGIGVMRRAKSFVNRETLLNIYNSIILPYFNNCSRLWDKCGSVLKEKLQKRQNIAARVSSGKSYQTLSSDILQAQS